MDFQGGTVPGKVSLKKVWQWYWDDNTATKKMVNFILTLRMTLVDQARLMKYL